MQENLEQYGVAQLTEVEQTTISGGDELSNDIMYAAGVVVGGAWWLMRAAGSALGFKYMNLDN